ncbi:MAG: C-GCAxxG-C-C family protein [Chloroflexota bacterium]|nr:C-GCAxxG-C-C family protein [Chloroflexota bacterium]
MKISRREAISTIGGAVAGLAIGSFAGCSKNVSGKANLETGKHPDFWKPHKLDTDETAQRAYDGFYNHGRGCCYGVFSSVIGQMAEKYGEPYNMFPMFMMKFGYSGVSNWGTLCGALIGASAMYALFYYRTDRDPMIDELFTWYEKTALPIYQSPKPVLEFECEQTIAKSVLCHNSVSKWSYKSEHEIHSKERSERCARLTADVAIKAVEILNAKIDQTFTFAGHSESVDYCGECHGKGKESDIAKGKMDCETCHNDKLEDHP